MGESKKVIVHTTMTSLKAEADTAVNLVLPGLAINSCLRWSSIAVAMSLQIAREFFVPDSMDYTKLKSENFVSFKLRTGFS